MMPPGGDLAKDRKAEQKVDMKKRTQAEIEQEMAALQYTNPMLLEVRGGWRWGGPEEPPRPPAAHALLPLLFQQMKMDRMSQMNSEGNVSHPQGQAPPSSFSAAGGPPGQQGFPLNMPQQMGPPMAPGNMQAPFMPPGQMGPHSGGMMGPPDMQGLQGMQRHSGPPRNMGPQGPHGMVPRGMQGPPPPRGMGPRDPQGPPHQGGMIQHVQGGMMGPPSRSHGNMPNNYGMQGPPGGMHGSQGNVQGPPENLQAPPYMHQVG